MSGVVALPMIGTFESARNFIFQTETTLACGSVSPEPADR